MKRLMRRGLALLAAGILVGPSAGCYSKVVSAQGFGADKMAIEKGDYTPNAGTRTMGYPKYTPKTLPGS